ncbi:MULTISPECIES: hypothetical protein [unclassified Desulfovibrio]|uniref:hypothetical protein n=1 Tax=unclassified Desulfovibrio TaxID=2593640 RepID=UPI002FD940B6
MIGTSQGVHHVALKEQNPATRNGPYPTECLIVAANGINVKIKPVGKLFCGNAVSQMFFKKF